MRLQAVLIKDDFPDIAEVDKLICRIYTAGNSMQIQDLIRISKQEHFDLWAIYDIEILIGFMVVLRYPGMAYLFSLALDPELCSKGDESRILSLLNEMYPSCAHLADVRLPGEREDEVEGRIRYFIRRRAYVRNGYRPTGRFILSSGIFYEILSKDDEFDVVSFAAMLRKIENNKGRTPVLLSKYKLHEKRAI